MIFLHQFDPTTSSPLNLVPNEVHAISNATAFTIVANAGLFYTNSFIAVNPSTSAAYIKGTDYKFLGFDSEITALTGFECASAITFTNNTVTGNVSLTYQAVGGREGENSALVISLRNAIAALSTETATWAEVLNKPSLFPPEDHTHNIITDLTGLNALTNQLTIMTNAFANSRVPTLSASVLSERIYRLLNLVTIQKQEINNLSSIVSKSVLLTSLTFVTTAETLPPTIAGGSIVFNSASDIIVFLPEISALLGNTAIDFVNIGSGTVTLKSQTDNDINAAGTSSNQQTLVQGANLTLKTNGTAWYKFFGTSTA